jgi:hypothetical protein
MCNADFLLAGLGKRRHEALKRDTELIRIETAEQPAERIVARRPVLQVEEITQEWLFGLREQCHIHATLAAAQNRTQGNDQQGVEIVQGGIAGPGVLQVFEAGSEPIQRGSPGRV